MHKTTREIVSEIASIDFESPDFLSQVEEKCAELRASENAFWAVEPLLKILETHANTDFGNPGPIVHFVEGFYKRGYEELLLESVKRSPTELTVWMVNRILNALPPDVKPNYLDALRAVELQDVSLSIKSSAAHFLGLHK